MIPLSKEVTETAQVLGLMESLLTGLFVDP